jgi:PAS domain S-box-containing protein
MIKRQIILEILKAIPGTLNVVDTNYNILMVGGELARTFEDIDQIIGKKCHKIFQKRDNPCPWCKVNTVIKTGDIVDETTTPDDPREKLVGKPLNINIRPLKDQDGKIIGAIELGTDINHMREADEKRRRAEEALKIITDEQAVLLASVPAMIFWIDKEGNFVRVNEPFAGALNKSADEISGKSLFDLYPEDQARKYHSDNVEVIESGIPKKNIEEPVQTPAGTIWVCTHKIPYQDKENNNAGIIGFSVDITERKQTEEALKDSEAALRIRTKELEEANRALRVLLKQRDEYKTELEEKVMLNVRGLVLPYAEKLKKRRLDAKTKAYLSVLESNLNDIVSPFAHKLSSKHVGFTPAEIQIAHLIKDGRTTKDMAELLNISTRTIESHRQNIRMKLGLHGKKANLRSHLLSM